MTLASLTVPNTPEIHFDHEDRPLFVQPGRLTMGAPQRDELNRDRFRVNVAFTLPPLTARAADGSSAPPGSGRCRPRSRRNGCGRR